MIKFENVTFAYDGSPVVNGFSLNIADGNWTGIVGPNGAGKTTIMRLASGLLKPDAGKISMNGNDLRSYSRKEAAKIIAVVPQSTTFAFPFSAFEVVLMGRFPYLKRFGFETEHDIDAARCAMIRTDTWQWRSRPIDELSGGERQRVLIARALAEEPRILLLDEPTSFLDIRHQAEVMDLIDELNKNEGLTVVSAIHDINIAISYCREIALIKDGRLVKKGEPSQVITYANLKEIFEAEVYVGVNEFTGKPYYIPMKQGQKEA